jgi:lipopolysaccharide transport protein LptA
MSLNNKFLFSEEAAKTEPQTTITCKGNLDMDYEKNMAVFHDDVVVDDPQMKMTAKEMTVFFEPNSKSIDKVIAKGQVRFKKEDKTAMAENAVYTAKDGKVILTGKPMVKKGQDVMSGDKITFFRNDQRMLIEPRAKLIFYSSEGKGKKGLDQEWL